MQRQAKKIKLLMLDVDGVLTDGSLYFSANGDEMKMFNTLDGQGMVMLQKTGIKLALITGRQSKMVEIRAQELNIEYVYQGIKDKLVAFETVLTQAGLTAQQCGYVGDDIVDLPPMRRAAFAVAMPHAPSIVRENAHYVTQASGGKGAVREVCDLIMQVQGTYHPAIAHYLR